MRVCIVKSSGFSNEEIKGVVFEALDAIALEYSTTPSSILIKVNLCYYWDYTTGETSDPRVIKAIIDYVHEKINRNAKIVVGEADASAMRTKHAFQMLGFETLAEEKDVELVNLSKESIRERQTKVGSKVFNLPVSDLLVTSDLVINASKLKYHRSTKMTCAMKNMFGAIAKRKKSSYHPVLHEAIVAINKIVKSDINIVDGIIALGKHPRKMGIVLTSQDRVAVDHMAARIMGYKPKQVKYLRLAKKEGLGPLEPIELIERNTTLKEARKIFPKVNNAVQKISWGLQIYGVRLYARLLGDVIPQMLED